MPTITAAQSVFTYQDALDRLLSYCNQNGSQASVSAVKQAVLDAYDDLTNDRNWRYFNRSYRFAQEEPETGTCYYTSSTGEFTIDTGTWPTWAERAVIEIDNVRHFIKTRSSSTVLLADDTMRPSADIVTGTTFTIYKCVYQLPMDFRRLYRPLDEQSDTWSDYCDFSSWFNSIRYRSSAGFPTLFAVSGDPYEPVRQVLLVNPTGDTEGEALTISENGTPTDAVVEYADESDLIDSVTPPTGWTVTGGGVGETNVQFTANAVGVKVLAVSAHSSDGTYSVAGNQTGENAVEGFVEIRTITPVPTLPTGGTWKAKSGATANSGFDESAAGIASAIYNAGAFGIASPSVTGTLDIGTVTVEFVEEEPKSTGFLSPENIDLTAPEITHSIS